MMSADREAETDLGLQMMFCFLFQSKYLLMLIRYVQVLVHIIYTYTHH